ncbi:MAG: hypothetical protein WCG79_07620 [Verrucomicrobiota bacterium]
MPFNPNEPQNGEVVDADLLRAQLNALHAEATAPETEPAFTGSEAAKLVAGDKAKLDAAAQPGGTVSQFTNDAGYLTTVPGESDPVFTGSEAALFAAGDKARLDAALQPGAGVSALANDAGYLRAADLPATLRLDQTTPQTVANGLPVFAGGIQTSGVYRTLLSDGVPQLVFDFSYDDSEVACTRHLAISAGHCLRLLTEQGQLFLEFDGADTRVTGDPNFVNPITIGTPTADTHADTQGARKAAVAAELATAISVPGYWAGNPPATLGEAVLRLAAVVSQAGSQPIP